MVYTRKFTLEFTRTRYCNEHAHRLDIIPKSLSASIVYSRKFTLEFTSTRYCNAHAHRLDDILKRLV